MINYVNNEVFSLCIDNQKIEFIQHSNFEANCYLNYDIFRKGKVYTSNIGLRQLAKDFISHLRLIKFNVLSFQHLFRFVLLCWYFIIIL